MGKLTDDIYDFLVKNSVGMENAISAKELSCKFNISERRLRMLIRDIRTAEKYEKIIGSSNAGYFLCKDKDEFKRANCRLYSEAFDLLKTARTNERKAGYDKQMKIDLEDIDTYGTKEIETFYNS